MVKEQDDPMSATRYAQMCLRFAKVEGAKAPARTAQAGYAIFG